MFSVIIPLKSFHNYLEPCFKSIYSQTYKPKEIIFIFNNADKKVKEFTYYFSNKFFNSIKLKYLESQKPGPGDARNKGFLNSQEKFLAFLDSDDIWPENYLEIRKKIILENNYEFISSDTIIYDDLSKKSYLRSCKKSKLTFDDFRRGNPIATSATIVSKNLLQKIGGFSTIKKRNDFATWLKVSKISNCYYATGFKPVFIIKKRNSLSSNKISLIKYNFFAFREIGMNQLNSSFHSIITGFYSYKEKFLWKYINSSSKTLKNNPNFESKSNLSFFKNDKNKIQIIFFANTLWFLIAFKKDLIKRLSENFTVKCYYLFKGDLNNKKMPISLTKEEIEVQYIKLGILNILKEFFLSLFAFFRLKDLSKKRYRILVFTIAPIFLSRLIFFSNKSSIVYILEGLGRVFSSRRIYLRILKRFVENVYKYLFKNIKKIVVLNQNDAAYLAKKNIAKFNQIYIIPGTGLNTKKYNIKKFDEDKNEKFIDFVGRILPDKGFYEFIYSREVLIRQHPKIAEDFKYRVIAPSSQIKKLGKLQLDHLKKQGIIFCPYISDTTLYYLNSCILVHPTEYGEGLSMVVLETAYLGIKVITTRNRGTEEILNSDYKYFLNKNSSVEIAYLIAKTFSDKEYFENLTFNLRKRINKLFDSESSINKFLEIIE